MNGIAERGRARSGGGLLRMVLALALALAGLVVVVPTVAKAAGELTLAKSHGSVLLGGSADFTLSATNTTATTQYNLSFSDVLPPGVTYTPGSTTPASFGDPTVTTFVSGTQTYTLLVWSNVIDIAQGATVSLSYSTAVSETQYPLGSTITNSAHAATSTDPYVAPDFDGTGLPSTGVTYSASASTTATVTAVTIAKASSDTPEGELLRGVGDHQSTYTLTVTNNKSTAVYNAVVVDYLPAGLEFLGCGGSGGAISPAEYTGAKTSVAAVSGCVQPASVTTVNNPADHPSGVYTMVTWNLGTLNAGDVIKLPYAVGIPMRMNTMTFTGGTPGTTGQQTANLNNNNGTSTRETATELSFTNAASISGNFGSSGGKTVGDDTTHTVTAEDLRVVKSASTGTFVQGGTVTYTLTIDTSEYVAASGIAITDHLPSGLCPIGAALGSTSFEECDPTAGTPPTGANATFVATPDAAGAYTLVFTPTSDQLAHSSTMTIKYSASMRTQYTDGEPTRALDTFTNNVSISGTATPRSEANPPETSAVTVYDTSSTTLVATAPQLVKTRLANNTADDPQAACSTTASQYSDAPKDTPFRLGDRVCYLIQVAFSSAADTQSSVLTDFLPANLTYEGVTYLNDSDLLVSNIAPTDRVVIWTFNDQVKKNSVFTVVLAAKVTSPVVSATQSTIKSTSNLAKFRFRNTANQWQALRDSVTADFTPGAPIALDKTVQAINGSAAGSNRQVQAGDAVTFGVTVTNSSTDTSAYSAMSAIQVWDNLPAGMGCTSVTAISNGGTCDTATNRISWTLAGPLAHGASTTLTYNAAVPTDVSVSTVYTNTAGVRSYQTPTNVTGRVSTHYPASNIDTSVDPALIDVPAANDTETVRTADAAIAKTRTTSVNQTNNDPNTQATIGEGVTYTITVTIPAKTSVYNASMTDSLPAGLVSAGTATATLDGGALPSDVTVDGATGTLTFLAAGYANTTSADQKFVVTIPTRVSNASTTSPKQGDTVINTATFTSTPTAAGGAVIGPRTASTTTTVIEPQPAITKSRIGTGAITGGSTVTFQLAVSNASGRPALAETVVVDCLPAPFSYTSVPTGYPAPTSTTGDPATYGCAAGTTPIVWNVGSLAGTGVVTNLRLNATVTGTPPAGSSYTNTGLISGRSLGAGDAPADQTRVYSASSSLSVSIAPATVVKTATPTSLTIGQRGSWTITTTLPAYTVFYDSTITDALPAGFTLSGTGGLTTDAVSCSGFGTDPCPTLTWLTPTQAAPPTGAATIGWSVGSLGSATVARTIVVTYSAVLADVAGNAAGTSTAVNKTNTGYFRWNLSEKNTAPAVGNALDTNPSGTRSVQVVEPAIVMSKSVDDSTPEPGQVFTYTVTASNTGRSLTSNLSPAYNVTVVDTVPAGVVPQTINDDGVWNATNRTITWTYAGPIVVSGSHSFSYTAQLDASSTLTSTGLVNSVRASRYESLATGGRTSYTAGPATSTVTPQFPVVTPTKDVSTQVAYVGQPVTWTITLSNSGGADARNAKAVDTLPPNWTYDDGSAQYSINGSAYAPLADPAYVSSANPQVLTWATGKTIPARSGTTDGTLKITFTARPTSAATTTPGTGTALANAHTNTATAVVEDGTGATANKTGAYASGTGTASTYIHAADLQLTKTASGNLTAGGSVTWSIAVTNAGPNPAVAPITVVDTLPSQDVFDSFSYDNSTNGWACSLTARTLTCTRSSALGAGASAPAITVQGALKASAAGGVDLLNSATVGSPTFDPNLDNNTGAVTVTTKRSVDIQIVKKVSSATVVAGQNVTYTLDVKNNGLSDSGSGTFTVTDDLPSGLSLVSVSGTDWTCSESPVGSGKLSCTTTASPKANGTLNTITVTAKVGTGVTGPVANTAVVAGPEPALDPNTGNNSSTATFTPTTSADLALSKVHSTGADDWIAGGTGAYTFTVLNYGPSDAAAPRVVDVLPASLSFVSGPSSGPWSCSNSGQTVTCTRSSAFAAGTLSTPNSESFAITVTVDPNLVTGTNIHNEATVSSSTPDPDGTNNTGGDNTATTQRADLGITKSGPASATAGGAAISFTLVVHNYGPSNSPAPAGAITPITVSDTLPDGMSYDGSSGTNWTCSATGQVVTCTLAAGLAGGSDAPTLTINARVASGIPAGTLTNHASVAGPLPDTKPENNSDQKDVNITVTPSLAITKTATPTTVIAGTNVTYTIVVRSTGPSDATNVELTDPLATGLTFVGVTGPSGWTCSATAVDCTRPRMVAGTDATFTVTATVGAGAAHGSTIVNTARVTGDGGLSTSARATVTVDTRADLSLTKTHNASADPVPAGTDVTFTLTAKNTGPSDAQAGILLTDTLPAGMTYVSNGTGWTCTPGTAGPSGQVVTCILDAGLLQAGVTATPLTMTVHIAADLAASANPLKNSATVESTTTSGDDGAASDTVPVTFHADLGITKDGPATADAGAQITYELRVRNWGPSRSPAPGSGVDPITVTDQLPVGLTVDSVSGGPDWDCTHSGRTISCELQTGLAVDATAPVISVTATSDPSLASGTTLDNTAHVTGPLPEPSGASHANSDSHQVTLTTAADVTIDKTADAATVHAGAQVVYSLVVGNDGPSDALDVTVTDPLAAGLSLVEVVPPNADWTCTAGATVNCTTARLKPGAANAVTITVTATVASGVASGTSITNTASVASPTDPAGDSDDAVIGVDTRADLTLTKTHDSASEPILAGDEVTFTLTTKNTGPSDALATIRLTDTLPAGMAYVGNDPGWTCTAAPATGWTGQTVTCDLDAGTLAAGDSAALVMTVRVDPGLDPETTSLRNEATVTSTTTPGDDGHATDTVPIGYSADLSVAKTHDPAKVRVGDPLAFTLQVHNAGPTDARDVVVTDNLPAGLDFVSAVGTGSPSGWTCSFATRTITCALTGTLAKGDAEPITVTATVLSAAYPGVTNTAAVESGTRDPDPDNNSTTDKVTVPAKVDLSITKSHAPEPLQVGQQATYTLSVGNTGATNDPGTITVTDPLPAGLTFVSGTGDGWACSAAGQDVTCTRPSGLATGSTTAITLVVAVGPGAYPSVTNTATVGSPAEDVDHTNNTASDPATVLPLYDLGIAKQLKNLSGRTASWTITVTNSGPNVAPDGVVVVDTLPDQLSYVGHAGDGWSCSASGQVVTCGHPAAIAVDTSASVVVTTRVASGFSGKLVNTAAIDGTDKTASASVKGPSTDGDLAYTGAGGVLWTTGLGLLLVTGGALALGGRRRRS